MIANIIKLINRIISIKCRFSIGVTYYNTKINSITIGNITEINVLHYSSTLNTDFVNIYKVSIYKWEDV